MLYENIQAWYDKARQDGEKTGEERGILEGERRMLIRLLEDEFGSVDNQTRFLIQELGEESLHACFKRLKLAKSVHDVVGHLS